MSNPVKIPNLLQHIEKYKSMEVRVVINSVEADKKLASLPKEEEKESTLDPSDPNFIRPVTGRHTGERHLLVLPSLVQGKGLFTRNAIKAEEFIIEYAGEVIPTKTALTRQNWYNFRRINNYVMQMDKDTHIDATFEGNCARFINHSCEPNCTAEILTVRKTKRVLIIALRDIAPGEELMYDYHFISDELVPCHCGTASCRLFLNYNVKRLKLKPMEIKTLLQQNREA